MQNSSHPDSFRETLARLRAFREARNWARCHTPRNLAQSIMIEGAELLELYQWGEEAPPDRARDELADVLIYALNLADVLGLDPVRIVHEKIDRNERRFPVSY